MEKSVNNSNKQLFNKERLNALSDGIFAIAMTLLVLDIRLPDNLTPGDFGSVNLAFSKLAPQFLSYVISFVVSAVYWINHRRLMERMEHINNLFTRVSLLFLFFITLLPVSTNFFGRYGGVPSIDIFYTLNLAICGLMLSLMAFYVARKPELTISASEAAHIYASLPTGLTPSLVFILSLFLLLFPGGTHILPYSWLLILFVERAIKILYTSYTRKKEQAAKSDIDETEQVPKASA